MDEGIYIFINPDAHSTDDLENIKWGVIAAQKGGSVKRIVLNAQSTQSRLILFTNSECSPFFTEIPHFTKVSDTTSQFNLKDLGKLSESIESYCTTLISLSFYTPLSNYEVTLIKIIRPNKYFGYENYKLLMQDRKLSKLPMFIKYFKVCNLDYKQQNRKLPDQLTKEIPFGMDESKVKICFHIDTDKSKKWFYDNWLKVIDELIGYSKFEIVLLGQPKLAKNVNTSILYPDSFLSNLYQVIYCDFFFGIDSCFAHIADAHLKKGLVLFGPVNFHEWKPYSKNLKAIRAKAGNLDNIAYGDVWLKIKKMLAI